MEYQSIKDSTGDFHISQNSTCASSQLDSENEQSTASEPAAAFACKQELPIPSELSMVSWY